MCENCRIATSGELPLISNAFLIVTERCNLACKYCFVQQNPKEMSLEVAMDSVKFIIRNAEQSMKVPSVWFFGGEPLLKWDEIIVPITDYIRKEYKKPCGIGFTSNCVLLDDTKIEYMKENEMTLLMSFDGAKCTQDINRPTHGGSGSFDLVYPKLKKVVEHLPHTTIRATIDHDTAKYTFENMKFLHEHNISNSFFYTNAFVKWTEEEYEELRAEFRKFSDYFIEEVRKGHAPRHAPLDTAFKKVLEINEAIDKGSIKRCDGTITAKVKCGLGSSSYGAIGTDGVIYGCQEMPSQYMTKENNPFYIGDIYDGVDDKRRIALIEEYQPKQIQTRNCDQCKLNPICDGGCVANNYLITGDFNTPPDTFCKYQQFLLDEAIYIMNVLGEEKNQFFKDMYFRGYK